jgi:hypothetical protein
MTGNPNSEDATERDDDRTAIVVGLIATPPDYPRGSRSGSPTNSPTCSPGG